MNRKSIQTTAGTALAESKTGGNPEGKGLNGFLLDVHRSAPRGVVAKPRRQVLAELFTSMLVLSSHFKFRPAVGVRNYLYWIDGEWSLSLIAPDEWSPERQAGFVATCILQRDMTWTVDPSAQLGEPGSDIANAVGQFFDGFAAMLDTDLTLEEVLPYHVRELPYYQRLHAYALSRSVTAAMTLGDQLETPCRDWQRQLPEQRQQLLASAGY